MSGCCSIYNLYICLSNTFETARYNMIIHVIVFLVIIIFFLSNIYCQLEPKYIFTQWDQISPTHHHLHFETVILFIKFLFMLILVKKKKNAGNAACL